MKHERWSIFCGSFFFLCEFLSHQRGSYLFWLNSTVGWFSYLSSKRFNYGHKAFSRLQLTSFLSLLQYDPLTKKLFLCSLLTDLLQVSPHAQLLLLFLSFISFHFHHSPLSFILLLLWFPSKIALLLEMMPRFLQKQAGIKCWLLRWTFRYCEGQERAAVVRNICDWQEYLLLSPHKLTFPNDAPISLLKSILFSWVMKRCTLLAASVIDFIGAWMPNAFVFLDCENFLVKFAEGPGRRQEEVPWSLRRELGYSCAELRWQEPSRELSITFTSLWSSLGQRVEIYTQLPAVPLPANSTGAKLVPFTASSLIHPRLETEG